MNATSKICLCFGCLLGLFVLHQPSLAQNIDLQQKVAPAVAKTGVKPNFDTTEPQVGHEVPDLSLLSLKGEPQILSDAWRNSPALCITSSLTCPKSRSRWPEIKAIADKYGDKINIVLVYVIEAHPVGSICPYKGVEDITPENERDGILRKQPATLEDRLALAQEFKRYLKIDLPIYIDNEQNQAWKALGAKREEPAADVRPILALLMKHGAKFGMPKLKPAEKLPTPAELKSEIDDNPFN
jgi:Iodothyronine deiodinase